jgi:ubiquinone/menaquinone biosynthesis C-methylase UbiE
MKFGLKDYYYMFINKGFRLPIIYFFQNHLFDIINKTDTHKWLPKENFTDRPKDFDNGVLYMSSWTSVIKKSTTISLNLFSLNSKDVVFVDIGCGKGKVLCVWKKILKDVKEIIGIEYSQQLLDICKDNLKKISSKLKINLIHDNALNLKLRSKDNFYILYLYNPFNKKVLEKFIKILKNRKVIIIYNNPIHKDIFLKNNFIIHFLNNSWHPNSNFIVFSNIHNFSK